MFITFEGIEASGKSTQAEALARMLEFSKGRRAVPVIVDDAGQVAIGFGGT